MSVRKPAENRGTGEESPVAQGGHARDRTSGGNGRMVTGGTEDQGIDDRQPQTHRGETEQHDARLVENESDAKSDRCQYASGAHHAWCAEAPYEGISCKAPHQHCHRERGEAKRRSAAARPENVPEIETAPVRDRSLTDRC